MFIEKQSFFWKPFNDKSNSSLTNPAVCVLDFGADKSASSGNFKVVFPTGDVSNAIIRIA